VAFDDAFLPGPLRASFVAMLGQITLAARAAACAGLDLVLPPRPLDDGADERVGSHGLTVGAWSRISFVEAPFCDGCGAPFELDPGPGVRCKACAARPPAFDHARAACLYDEHARDLVLKLKHADRTDLAGLFARWLARAAADITPQLDAVTPVPLHRGRLLSRRYNQAAEIGRPLSRLAGLRYFADAVVRRRATGSQGGKSAGDRRANVEGVFHVPERWRRKVDGARLLIIDDVLTTGATVEGCARALKAAGAARVDVAVIARVQQIPSRPI
jgi:ComF family protein